ncbi:MAG: TetR/AcrR family transcriptional regulator [Pseudohongiella sp.]|uniref:TetR/AcrR family transcriptional regulator n=1 Tax=Pseudohongiella sp. TaxID=1979412 RepID=UPI0034A06C4D
MPKIVDHDRKREEIAHAVWRLVIRDGMAEVSVRNVAREAGMSQGALRYYFSTRTDLVLFSMQQVTAQVTQRVQVLLQQPGSPQQRVREMLLQILPMDEQRRLELRIWWILVHYSLTDERLQAHTSTVYDQLQGIMQGAIEYLNVSDALRPGTDVNFEVERLYSLVDGLALHAILKPGAMTPGIIERVLDGHLDSITR